MTSSSVNHVIQKQQIQPRHTTTRN